MRMKPINPLGADDVLPGSPLVDCGSFETYDGRLSVQPRQQWMTVGRTQGTSQHISACSRKMLMLSQLVRWPIMDTASASGVGDSRFESWVDQCTGCECCGACAQACTSFHPNTRTWMPCITSRQYLPVTGLGRLRTRCPPKKW